MATDNLIITQLEYGENPNLVLSGHTFALAPSKVERKKLYGWTELRATDTDGYICRQVGLDSNGREFQGRA